jgi:hypothetical protein
LPGSSRGTVTVLCYFRILRALTLARDRRYLSAGQGGRVGQGRGPVGALGGLLDALGHRHHQVIVVPRLLGRG